MTAPERLARLRPVEKLQPGWWFLGIVEGDELDGLVQMWCRVSIALELDSLTHGPLVRVFGLATDGGPIEFTQRRGFSVESLTEAEGRRCGLFVPEAGMAES